MVGAVFNAVYPTMLRPRGVALSRRNRKTVAL
jgi:hypothetical protein